MGDHHPEEIHNVALVGQSAAGKTCLAERMLERAEPKGTHGQADRRGNGEMTLDSDEEERARHISIFSHLAHFERHGHRVNVIDTPGYVDFSGQMLGALRAVETAVVVLNGCAGVEANTRRAYAAATAEGLARVFVVTHCDAERFQPAQTLALLRETFGSCCVALNVPVGSPEAPGVLSLLDPLPSPLPDATIDPAVARRELVEAVVEGDDELMTAYFEGVEPTRGQLETALTNALAAGRLVPVLFASPTTGAGLDDVMDVLADLTPSAALLLHHATDGQGNDVPLAAREEGPVVAQVFKTRIDPFVGKLSYLRVYSGRLRKEATLSVESEGTSRTFRVHGILDAQGATQTAAEEAGPGDIIVLAKIDALHVGDTVTTGNGFAVSLPPIPFPTPMIGLAVEPKSRADQQRISAALARLEEEDPTVRVRRDGQTHELILQGVSDLHLQVVRDRMAKREHVETIARPPRVAYRETATRSATGSHRHKKQTGGAGQFAEVHLRVHPLPEEFDPQTHFTRENFPGLRSFHYDPETNFAFLDSVTGGTVPNQFIPAVEKGVREAMEQGTLIGAPVSGVAVELFFGKDHPVDSNETAFRTAGRTAFREVFAQAGPALLEPYAIAEITLPDVKRGEVTADLTTRRGHVLGVEVENGQSVLRASVPLAEMTSYARHLAGMTGSQGSFVLQPDRYQPVPGHLVSKLIAAAGAREGGQR